MQNQTSNLAITRPNSITAKRQQVEKTIDLVNKIGLKDDLKELAEVFQESLQNLIEKEDVVM